MTIYAPRCPVTPARFRAAGRPLVTALLAAASLLAAVCAPLPAAAAPARADLIGYGRLEMTVQRDASGSGTAIFQCEDAAHADRLLSKLRADFTWDGLLGLRAIQLSGGVPALALEGGAVLVLAERDSAVYVLSAATPAAAADLLSRRQLAAPATHFRPLKAHPRTLDYFDLRPLDMNFNPFNLVGQDVTGGYRHWHAKAELEKAHAFWAPKGIGAVVWGGYVMFGFSGHSDGPVSVFPELYTIGLARAHDQSVMVHLGNSMGAPWWLQNKFPRQISQLDPHVLPVWGSLGVTGGRWLSFSASDDAYAYVQGFTQHVLDSVKQAAGEDLACLRPLGGGRPGDELGLHHYSTEFMDYDETGQAAFRRWLREERQLDLAALGRRWHGDDKHFADWDQVRLPSNVEFFGGLGLRSYTMQQGWLWRPDRKDAEREGWGQRDYRPGQQWTPVDLAPSARQLFLYNHQPDDATQRIGNTAWFRKEFDLSTWLAQEPGRPVYLVANTLAPQNEPVEVWLNGASLGKIRPKTVYCGPIAMQVTGLIGPGRNVLCLKVRAGLIYGPVFLTHEEPRRYPYLGREQNARWIDLRDWLAQRMIESWKREALLIRRQEPDMNLLQPPGGLVLSDRFLELKRDVGLGCVHDTGGFAGSYSGNFAGQGYTDGLYMTNEEGGTMADEAAQSRQLAWLLFEGVARHVWVYNAQSYVKFEQETGWFTKHRRLLSLVGKAIRSRPDVAVLHAGQSERYFPYTGSAATWDIGRGPLQAAHFNNAYVTETEIQNGLADQYPVVFDSNTTVMSAELVAALERYVRGGGTFVALHTSGRHALLEADTWPISRLTGFRVVGERPNGIITVEKHNPLLKKLAGMKFTGSGMTLNWMGIDYAKEHLPVAMEAAQDACVPLARWEDGTIAAGMRRLGRGRVIVLGSSFWFSKSDLAGNGYGSNGTLQAAFLDDLLSGLGVAKNVECSAEDVWARRMETKNGLQDWMILWNSSRDRADGVEISFPLEHRPPRVLDMESGTAVDFTYDNGLVRVARFAMAPNETRVLGVDRGDFVAAAVHWLEAKRRFESRPALKDAPRPPAPPRPEMPVIDQFRFRMADARAKTDLAWTQESTDGPAWKDAGYGFWDEMGFAPMGIGLYRGILDVPAAWKGKHVLLNLAAFSGPVFFGTPTMYLNGRLVGPGSSGGDVANTVLDVTDWVREGRNDLGILVETTEVRGGFAGTLLAYAQEDLQAARPLTGGWRLYQDDRQSKPVALPLKARGRHLETEVPIPANWKADEIYLDFTLGLSRNPRYVVINGRPVGLNPSGHALPNRMRINLYPWAKPGATNRIEFWSLPNMPTAEFDVQAVTLGTLPKANGR